MTVFESVQRNIAFGWKVISCNTVCFIAIAITAACNVSLGMVNNLSFIAASLDFASMNMVVTLLLLTDLKQAVSPYVNDGASSTT